MYREASSLAFLWEMKKLGWRTGRSLVRLDGVKALGCTRKFDEHGDWHYFTLMPRALLSLFTKGFWNVYGSQNVPDFVNYWYEPKR